MHKLGQQSNAAYVTKFLQCIPWPYQIVGLDGDNEENNILLKENKEEKVEHDDNFSFFLSTKFRITFQLSDNSIND